MKTNFISFIRPALKDRRILLIFAILAMISIVYTIYVGLYIHPTELQVAAHYTAYGETHFYRDQWYTLISLITLGLIVPIVHIGIVARLFNDGLRSFAIAFGYYSIGFVGLMLIYARSVLSIAFQ